jgi:hypothetical protein
MAGRASPAAPPGGVEATGSAELETGSASSSSPGTSLSPASSSSTSPLTGIGKASGSSPGAEAIAGSKEGGGFSVSLGFSG